MVGESLYVELIIYMVSGMSCFYVCLVGWQYLAVAKERKRAIHYLWKLGVDIHGYCDRDSFGTPLFHAIYNESIDVISTSPTTTTTICTDSILRDRSSSLLYHYHHPLMGRVLLCVCASASLAMAHYHHQIIHHHYHKTIHRRHQRSCSV